jgi:hypothetical protein
VTAISVIGKPQDVKPSFSCEDIVKRTLGVGRERRAMVGDVVSVVAAVDEDPWYLR